jgi:hypothetical protein
MVVFGCLKLNIYENGGPRDHWRQIQIAKNRNTQKHWLVGFIYGLCIGLGGWGPVVVGGWRVMGGGSGRVGSEDVLDVILHLRIHA